VRTPYDPSDKFWLYVSDCNQTIDGWISKLIVNRYEMIDVRERPGDVKPPEGSHRGLHILKRCLVTEDRAFKADVIAEDAAFETRRGQAREVRAAAGAATYALRLSLAICPAAPSCPVGKLLHTG
jgi:hypothetical protein